MNANLQTRFDAIGRLFRYPTEGYAALARELAKAQRASGSRAATAIGRFADYATSVSPHELEETFTRTFDLNPACAAEIGWHLFGEEYLRGLFMVRIRTEMRERGLEETGELPDHVVHVLAVLAAMEPAAACEFARACVCPAVGKMQRALAEGDSPFRPLVEALAEMLLEAFDLPAETLEAEEGDTAAFVGSDPLHGPPCGACGGGPELYSLERAHPREGSASAAAIEETSP
jgi:nitrate reductase molybdenum cofactor assembly chaperone